MGAKYFVLDLRDNLGGLVQVCYMDLSKEKAWKIAYNIYIFEGLCLTSILRNSFIAFGFLNYNSVSFIH